MNRRAALLLAMLLVLPAASARGQDQASGLGFGMRPMGPEATRGYFFFRDVAPGTTLTARLEISNVETQPKTVVLRAQDAATSGTGGLSYADVKDGPGSWVAPRQRRVEVPARRAVVVSYRIQVPQDARPGDHFGGVVAYDQADLDALEDRPKPEQAVQLKFISRLAVPFRVRVPGTLVAEVALRDVKLDVTPSGSSVNVIFANVGNVLIPRSEGRVNISQDDVPLTTQKIALTSFAPGSEITVRVPFRGAPAVATYRAQGYLQPLYAPTVNFDETVDFGSEQTRELKQETGVTAIGADKGGVPVWTVGLGALLLLGLVALLVRTMRYPRTAARPLPPAAAPQAGSIDINSASVDELTTLPGVGPAAAARIVHHRQEYGGFSSLEDLAAVEGFDQARIDALRERASAGGSPAGSEGH